MSSLAPPSPPLSNAAASVRRRLKPLAVSGAARIEVGASAWNGPRRRVVLSEPRRGRRGGGGSRIRAAQTGIGEAEESEGVAEVEGQSDKEAALRSTLGKAKEVLAVQNSLLEQIAKRRGLASSTTNLRKGTEEQSISNEEPEGIEKETATGMTKGRSLPANGSILFKAEDLAEAAENNVLSPNIKVSALDDAINKIAKDYTETKSIPPLSLGVDGQKVAQFVDSNSDAGVTSINEISDVQTSINETISDILETEVPSTLPLVEPVLEATKESHVGDHFEAEEATASVADTSDSEKQNNDSSPLAGANVMNIIVVAVECSPWIKTGGLGDVVGSLPKALARRGHRVMVVLPLYANYAEAQNLGIRKYYKVAGQDMEVTYFHAYIDNVDFVFLDSPIFRHRQNDIYGGQRQDVLKRMILLCKAAVEVPWHVPCGGICYGDGNLAFIANDWHTALLPVYLKAYYRDNGLMKFTRSILVIHNIAHQGRGPVDDFNLLDLPEHYLEQFHLYDPVGGDHSNVFAAGLKTADRVITVSQGYLWEIKTMEGGWGLHEIINHNHWKLHGIVNGIDTREWNPEFDEHLKSDGYTNYSLSTLDSGKRQCKAALQAELGLAVRDDVPLIGFIGRLDYQKGIDLIGDAMPWISGQDVQLVMLGTGRQDLEEMLRKFEHQHGDKVRAWVGFSVKMAHRITAGADIIIMPSRFEPCGLNQLYAMMYGTIPVAHAVGGLRDTVIPFDPFNDAGLGWTFDRAEGNKLVNALGHCLNTYRNYKDSWRGLQVRGMSQDLSWDKAAVLYEEVLVKAKYQW